MDYRKIILYLLIAIIIAALWIKSSIEEKESGDKTEVFASVYAGTAFAAELYRNEPDRFFQARDSIFKLYGVDSAWGYELKGQLSEKDEEWDPVWAIINNKVDSLVENYKNLIRTPPTEDSTATDSADIE